jgi:hypothetical protein
MPTATCLSDRLAVRRRPAHPVCRRGRVRRTGPRQPRDLLWPAVVVLVAVGLTAVRFSTGLVALGLLALAALAIGALIDETSRMGSVPSPSTACPSPSLAVLGRWWWVTARGRLVG